MKSSVVAGGSDVASGKGGAAWRAGYGAACRRRCSSAAPVITSPSAPKRPPGGSGLCSALKGRRGLRTRGGKEWWRDSVVCCSGAATGAHNLWHRQGRRRKSKGEDPPAKAASGSRSIARCPPSAQVRCKSEVCRQVAQMSCRSAACACSVTAARVTRNVHHANEARNRSHQSVLPRAIRQSSSGHMSRRPQ